MNGLINYIVTNYNLMILISGIIIVMIFHSNIGEKSAKAIKAAIILLLILTVVDSIEKWSATFSKPTYLRLLMSYIGFSIRPTIPLVIINIVLKDIKKYLILCIPAILNSLIYLTCFFSPIAFYYTKENIFEIGPLGYIGYLTAIFYLVALVTYTYNYFKEWNKVEGIVIVFLAIACLISAIIETMGFDKNILNTTIASSLVFYYLFLFIQVNKRDVLTGLLNRQAFYLDIKRNESKISAVIALDMNELKFLNDNYGHKAGDIGICTLSNCFKLFASKNFIIYRLGGDEFCILCIKKSEYQVRDIINRINKKISTTPYSCAIGYAIKSRNETVEDALKRADQYMYKSKIKMKKEIKEKKERLKVEKEHNYEINYYI